MFLLAFRNLRARAGRTFFTAFAIALGVGMIFAMRLVAATMDETARQARLSRLAGADLEVTSGVGAKIPLNLLETLDARPDIELAAPIYHALEGRLTGEASFSMKGAQLQGTGLALLGVDPARLLVPYETISGKDLQDFENPEGIATTPSVWLPNDWAALNGLHVGSKVTLTTAEITQDYLVVGLIHVPTDVPLTNQPTAWLLLSTLNAAFDTPDSTTSILIRLKPGINADNARDDLQTALGNQYIVASAGGGQGVGSIYNLISLALPVAGFAVLLTGAFLVFNAFAITLAERRREIGQLRTLGMTRGQILTQTLAEAGLVGLLGAAIGLILGWGLGRGVVAIIAILQGDSTLAETPIPLDAGPLAAGAGVLVTLMVTVGLAVEAARTSPLMALKTETAAAARGNHKARPYGLIAGIGLAIGTVVAYWYANSYARTATTPNYGWIFLPVLTFGTAVVCLLPAWVSGVLALAVRTFRGAIVRLAISNLHRGQSRATLTAATITISFMLIIALTGVTLFMSTFLLSMNSSMFSGRIVLVRPFPPGTSLTETSSLPTLPPIPPELQTDIDTLKDKAVVSYFANVSIPGVGVDAAGTGDRYAFAMPVRLIRDRRSFPLAEGGSWDEVERAFRENEPAIFLPEPTGRKLNKHPGDRIELDTLEGKVIFYVAGVGGAFPIISSESAIRYFGSHPFAIFFEEKPGVDRAELEAGVDALIDRNRTELSKLDTQQLVSVVDQLVGPLQGLFAGLTSLSGLVAALGIVVTLVASVLERQRELGTLRALGMSRAQVRGLVVLEAGLIGLAGASLGALGGLGMAWLFAQSMNMASAAMMGASAVENLVYPWQLAVASIFIGPLVAVMAALHPADRAANVNPAEAMRAEGATGFLKPAAHLGPTGLPGVIARLPLAAKLSLASGLILIIAMAGQTALRVNAERLLLEENLLSLFARTSDNSLSSLTEQLPEDVTELTPATLATIQQQAGAQADILQAQFQRLRESQTGDDFRLRYFFLTDLQHKVIYSDDTLWISRVLTNTVTPSGNSTLVRITNWSGERVFEGTVPIENKAGTRLGYLQVGISTEPVDNFIREVVVTSAWTMAITLLAAIALTIFFTRRALAPIEQIAEASHAVARGDLTRRVPETQWDEVGRLSRSFNDMVTGLNEREQLRELFGRYVSPEVREAIESGRVTLKGERKNITCLYVDMRGSTTFAEEHEPEDVMEALNQYFEVIVYAVEAHGGIVNRFVGDEAVCVFGAPTFLRDHAQRALQAALAMREGLAYLNHKREALSLPTLKFGIGLNTGEVVAGATGTKERQEYTVIGDAMNLGARIQALNKTFPDYDILASEFTVSSLREKAEGYQFVDLGATDIRGKKQRIRVFGVR